MSFDIIIVSIVILLGIIFLLAEIFLLPGITISGIAGLIFLVGGIVYAYMYMGSWAGNITMVVSVFLLMASFLYFIKSKSLKRIALTTNIDATVDMSDLKKINVGDIGFTQSRLNPMGKVTINGVTVEAKSMDGEMIDEDTEVEVFKVDWANIIVSIKKENIIT
ncbi:MAG: NfeD family protein [Candidatus Saccharimonadaceae bacterium]